MGKHATLERKKKRKAKGLKGPDGSQAGRLAKRAAQRAGDGRLVIVRAKRDYTVSGPKSVTKRLST